MLRWTLLVWYSFEAQIIASRPQSDEAEVTEVHQKLPAHLAQNIKMSLRRSQVVMMRIGLKMWNDSSAPSVCRWHEMPSPTIVVLRSSASSVG